MGHRLRVRCGSLIGGSLIAWVSLGGCFSFFPFPIVGGDEVMGL